MYRSNTQLLYKLLAYLAVLRSFDDGVEEFLPEV